MGLYFVTWKNGGVSRDERRNQEQQVHNANLNAQGCVLFIPSPDNPDQGIGWFFTGTSFVAYRKYSNGWDMYALTYLPVELVEALHKHIHKGI
jgi:hypothetical protein